MITEQYVSFETSKMLKEAGFNEICRCDYDNVDGFRWFRIGKSIPKGWFSCPTQSLAARWIRETHHIFLILTPMIDGWMYDLFDLDKHQYILCNADANTDDYESAFEVGLKEALQIIIKNKEDEKDNVQ